MLEDAKKSGLSYGYDDPDPPAFHEGKLSGDFNKERKMKHDYKLHKYSHHLMNQAIHFFHLLEIF